MIYSYKQFIKEDNSEILLGKDIARYVINITPDEDDIPFHFLEIIKKHNFVMKELNIDDLLKSDPDFKEYFESYDENNRRYSEDEVNIHDIDKEIVVVNGEVLDGYNRTTELYKNGHQRVNAYININ